MSGLSQIPPFSPFGTDLQPSYQSSFYGSSEPSAPFLPERSSYPELDLFPQYATNEYQTPINPQKYIITPEVRADNNPRSLTSKIFNIIKNFLIKSYQMNEKGVLLGCTLSYLTGRIELIIVVPIVVAITKLFPSVNPR